MLSGKTIELYGIAILAIIVSPVSLIQFEPELHLGDDWTAGFVPSGG